MKASAVPALLSLGKIYSFMMWDKLHAISMAWSAVDTTCTEPPQWLLLLALPALLEVGDEGMRQFHN